MNYIDMTPLSTLGMKAEGDVLTVTFDRPQTRNSVTVEFLEELIELARRLRSAEDIRFVVFRHEGPVFSSGADLKETVKVLSGSDQELEASLYRQQRLGQEMMASLEGIDQVTIAELDGGANRAGMAIAKTTDFRVMAPDAVFNLPETRAGTFLTWGCTARLAAAVGALRAKELIMLAEDLSAEQCVEVGLANAMVPAGELSAWTGDLVARLRARGPAAVAITKKLVNAATVPAGANVQFVEPFLVTGIGRSGEMLDGFRSVMAR
jgi:enoyl-CoA hydratase/carnithine racemase